MRRLTLAILIAAALAGGWVGWHDRSLRSDLSFAQRRITLLESERDRLSEALAAKLRKEDDALDAAKRKEIESAIASLRELTFKQPVNYREIGREELPRILRDKLLQQVPAQEFAQEGVALAAIGLLPPGIDLQKTYLALLGEQIGAFYDQHARELYTFTGHPLTNAANRVVMAHELTHALQDQNYGLARLPLEIRGNDDRALAASALAEGDATLAMNAYMAGNLGAAAIRDSLANALTTDVRQLVAAPKFLRETLLFPYLSGLEFCQRLQEQGGWAAIDAAYAHPPSSTAQILHPEKYQREEPVEVDLPQENIRGMPPGECNVLGEFGARELFKEWLHDAARAARVAAGWRGDRYIVYGDTKASSCLWRCVCRDDAAAREFARAQSDVLAARYAARASGRVFKAEALSGGTAVAVDAQDASWAAALVERFAPEMHIAP